MSPDEEILRLMRAGLMLTRFDAAGLTGLTSNQAGKAVLSLVAQGYAERVSNWEPAMYRATPQVVSKSAKRVVERAKRVPRSVWDLANA